MRRRKTLFISILLVKVTLTFIIVLKIVNCRSISSNEKERVEGRGEDTEEVRNDFP